MKYHIKARLVVIRTALKIYKKLSRYVTFFVLIRANKASEQAYNSGFNSFIAFSGLI